MSCNLQRYYKCLSVAEGLLFSFKLGFCNICPLKNWPTRYMIYKQWGDMICQQWIVFEKSFNIFIMCIKCLVFSTLLFLRLATCRSVVKDPQANRVFLQSDQCYSSMILNTHQPSKRSLYFLWFYLPSRFSFCFFLRFYF